MERVLAGFWLSESMAVSHQHARFFPDPSLTHGHSLAGNTYGCSPPLMETTLIFFQMLPLAALYIWDESTRWLPEALSWDFDPGMLNRRD